MRRLGLCLSSALVYDVLPRQLKLGFRKAHCWKGISSTILMGAEWIDVRQRCYSTLLSPPSLQYTSSPPRSRVRVMTRSCERDMTGIIYITVARRVRSNKRVMTRSCERDMTRIHLHSSSVPMPEAARIYIYIYICVYICIYTYIYIYIYMCVYISITFCMCYLYHTFLAFLFGKYPSQSLD